VVREQGAAATGRRLFDMPGNQQCRERRLGLREALGGRKFQPTPTLGAARRYAFALEVAQPDTIFSRGQLGLGGASHKLEPGIELAGIQSSLAFLEKPCCPAKVEPPENQRIYPLYPASLSASDGTCKRSPPSPSLPVWSE
jgi:hypothetical protein